MSTLLMPFLTDDPVYAIGFEAGQILVILQKKIKMNRVRKFKAYDKHTKKRVTDPMSFYMSMDDDGTLNVMHNIIVCDFTGFKDKNGTEIFEGDILKSWYSRDMSGTDIITTINEVEYDIKNESSGFEIVFLENSEVIGNVIENPELLDAS